MYSMGFSIEKDSEYAESNVTIIGLTQMYGRPQYVLVEARDNKLKFPGVKFKAPISVNETLEDCAKHRFEEQTGLTIDKMLRLRAIVPTRSRESNQWMFRNVFLGVVDDSNRQTKPEKDRVVFLADPGQIYHEFDEHVSRVGNSKEKRKIEYRSPDNHIIARIAKDITRKFNWDDYSTNWHREIPCVGVKSQAPDEKRELGCALAVSSMMLIYQEREEETLKIILLKRKGDKYPGYAGGKIETPKSSDSLNLDPISCCAKEGAEEYGFPIQPRVLICCAATPIDMPNPETHYNSIITYAFMAEPTNLKKVEQALKNPKDHLEGRMEEYVVETLDEHRDRILRQELRMPDIMSVGDQFFKTTPGEKISLNQIISSGVK